MVPSHAAQAPVDKDSGVFVLCCIVGSKSISIVDTIVTGKHQTLLLSSVAPPPPVLAAELALLSLSVPPRAVVRSPLLYPLFLLLQLRWVMIVSRRTRLPKLFQ